MANDKTFTLPDDITCVRMTEKELREIDALLMSLNYRCGDDGWVPTLKDVEEKLIGRYHTQARNKLMLAASGTLDRKKMLECDATLKQMWIFMYWIVETCPDMEPEAYTRLMNFVDSKCKIVR